MINKNGWINEYLYNISRIQSTVFMFQDLTRRHWTEIQLYTFALNLIIQRP